MKNNIAQRFKEIVCTKEEQISPKKRTDVAGSIFCAALMVAAIICFVALLINIGMVGAGEEDASTRGLICMCAGIAFLFLRWVVSVFSKIYLALLSINDKLDSIIDNTK